MSPDSFLRHLGGQFKGVEYTGIFHEDEVVSRNHHLGSKLEEYESIAQRLYYLAYQKDRDIQNCIVQYKEGRYLYLCRIESDINLWLAAISQETDFAKFHFFLKFYLSDNKINLDERDEVYSESEDDKFLSAKRIQDKLFPNVAELLGGLDLVHFFYQPKDIVGGDFYWGKKESNQTYVCIGDCTGHSMEGALASVSIMSILNNNYKKGIAPHLLIKKTHNNLRDLQNQNLTEGYGIGCEMIIIKINHADKTIEFSSSGVPLFRMRNGRISEFKFRKSILDPDKVIRYLRSRTIQIKKGDGFFMFSDGLPDQMNHLGKKLKRPIILRKFLEVGYVNDCVTKELIKDHGKGEEQTDDVCSLYFRF